MPSGLTTPTTLIIALRPPIVVLYPSLYLIFMPGAEPWQAIEPPVLSSSEGTLSLSSSTINNPAHPASPSDPTITADSANAPKPSSQRRLSPRTLPVSSPPPPWLNSLSRRRHTLTHRKRITISWPSVYGHLRPRHLLTNSPHTHDGGPPSNRSTFTP